MGGMYSTRIGKGKGRERERIIKRERNNGVVITSTGKLLRSLVLIWVFSFHFPGIAQRRMVWYGTVVDRNDVIEGQ
jgi:hypothetical protein